MSSPPRRYRPAACYLRRARGQRVARPTAARWCPGSPRLHQRDGLRAHHRGWRCQVAGRGPLPTPQLVSYAALLSGE